MHAAEDVPESVLSVPFKMHNGERHRLWKISGLHGHALLILLAPLNPLKEAPRSTKVHSLARTTKTTVNRSYPSTRSSRILW